ncbi:hypothetical protein D3C72_2473400 [compost metagenome]
MRLFDQGMGGRGDEFLKIDRFTAIGYPTTHAFPYSDGLSACLCLRPDDPARIRKAGNIDSLRSNG